MSDSIKVVSFNIEYCASISHGYWQYATRLWTYLLPHNKDAIYEIEDVITDEGIDIATFMEMDGGSYRTRNFSYMDILSRDTPLKSIVFYPVRKVFGLTNQGNGIATKFNILETQNIKLEIGRFLGENRYLSISKIDINGRTVHVLTTQLALGHSSRYKEFEHIARVINSIEGPIIFTGDLNTQKEKELDVLKNTRLKRIETTNTFPSWKPKRRIDYIFYSPDFEVVESYVIDKLKVSDHLPVVAEFKLKTINDKKIVKKILKKNSRIVVKKVIKSKKRK